MRHLHRKKTHFIIPALCEPENCIVPAHKPDTSSTCWLCGYILLLCYGCAHSSSHTPHPPPSSTLPLFFSCLVLKQCAGEQRKHYLGWRRRFPGIRVLSRVICSVAVVMFCCRHSETPFVLLFMGVYIAGCSSGAVH